MGWMGGGRAPKSFDKLWNVLPLLQSMSCVLFCVNNSASSRVVFAKIAAAAVCVCVCEMHEWSI